MTYRRKRGTLTQIRDANLRFDPGILIRNSSVTHSPSIRVASAARDEISLKSRLFIKMLKLIPGYDISNPKIAA